MPPVNRPFRGQDQAQEGQIGPIYTALDGKLSSDNVAASGILPLQTTVGTSAGQLTLGGNIAWFPTAVTFTSSTAAMTVTVSHGLSRTPQMYFEGLRDVVAPALQIVSTSSWNATFVYFGQASDSVSRVHKVILL